MYCGSVLVNVSFHFLHSLVFLWPTLERRRQWFMGYYWQHFTTAEYKMYGGEDRRLHLEEDISMDINLIWTRDCRRFVWIHHLHNQTWELLQCQRDNIMPLISLLKKGVKHYSVCVIPVCSYSLLITDIISVHICK